MGYHGPLAVLSIFQLYVCFEHPLAPIFEVVTVALDPEASGYLGILNASSPTVGPPSYAGSEIRGSAVGTVNLNQNLQGFMQVFTLPETKRSPLKMDGWNTTFLLGRPIFRGYVSFTEGSRISEPSTVESWESIESTTQCHPTPL